MDLFCQFCVLFDNCDVGLNCYLCTTFMTRHMRPISLLILSALLSAIYPLQAQEKPDSLTLAPVDSVAVSWRRHSPVSPYSLPFSKEDVCPDSRRLWQNTAVLSGAFVSTLLVLEMLPEDATSWNRAEIQDVPPLKRWFRNIFKRGPEWDHDNAIFNYVLHPYAGSVYFMAARSCGYGFWHSMLYSAAISTIGWEFGIEAFMERPSYQDIIITPMVGSIIGEMCYKGKYYLVNNDYELLGSRTLGRVACFVMDPVNEVLDLIRGGAVNRRDFTLSVSPSGRFVAMSLTF